MSFMIPVQVSHKAHAHKKECLIDEKGVFSAKSTWPFHATLGLPCHSSLHWHNEANVPWSLQGNTQKKSLKLFLDPRPNPQSAQCGTLDRRR